MNERRTILLWFGNAPNQKALAAKIAANFPVAGIVVDLGKKNRSNKTAKDWMRAITDRIRFRKIVNAWLSIQNRYNKAYPDWPKCPVKYVDTINDDATLQFTRDLKPDLVVVSGTALIKEKNFSLPLAIGMINLHTGLSPYVKGGPNCTNWCIATGEFEKIGNTIMWIDKGIDSGNIIASERTPFKNTSDLAQLQWEVMEHAHDLYVRVIDYLLKNQAPYNSIPQKQLGKGRLFLTKQWNFKNKNALIKNLQRLKQHQFSENVDNIKTISLPEGNG